MTGAEESVAPGGLAYVSLNFYPEGERPPPADPERLEGRQWDMAGLAVFDAWIACQDRHLRNIVFEPDLGVPLTVIDFDQSMPSHLDLGMGVGQLVRYRPGDLLREPHELITAAQPVKEWIDRVMSLPRHTVEGIVGQAVNAAAMPADVGEQVAYVLVERGEALPTLFKEDWEAGRILTRIDEWGLV